MASENLLNLFTFLLWEAIFEKHLSYLILFVKQIARKKILLEVILILVAINRFKLQTLDSRYCFSSSFLYVHVILNKWCFLRTIVHILTNDKFGCCMTMCGVTRQQIRSAGGCSAPLSISHPLRRESFPPHIVNTSAICHFLIINYCFINCLLYTGRSMQNWRRWKGFNYKFYNYVLSKETRSQNVSSKFTKLQTNFL